MRVELLPSNCEDPRRLQPLTTFLINGNVAIDGGSLGFALSERRQLSVRKVVVTHSHNDHIASLPIFVAEIFPFLDQPFEIYGSTEVIRSLKEHIFNDVIWPNFDAIPLLNGGGNGLRFIEIEPGVPFEIEQLRITPVLMNHVVPTLGLAVENARDSVIFTSDTYRTDAIWKVANGLRSLKAVFVDVSYPNEMEDLAEVSKHLTPNSLALELDKLDRQVPIYAFHIKPQFREKVIEQLAGLGRPDVQVAEIGREYVFGER